MVKALCSRYQALGFSVDLVRGSNEVRDNFLY